MKKTVMVFVMVMMMSVVAFANDTDTVVEEKTETVVDVRCEDDLTAPYCIQCNDSYFGEESESCMCVMR